MTEFKNLDPSEVKRGDVIEVSYDINFHVNPMPVIFVSYIKGAAYPYICVEIGNEKKFKSGEPFATTDWPYARKLRPDLKDGDPVIVWDLGNRCKRHFAGWTDNGRILTYVDGTTKWTSEGKTISWLHWRLPTKEESGL